MCDFQLPGAGHSFPLMYPVKFIVAHSLAVESTVCLFASTEQHYSELCVFNAVQWQKRCSV